MKHLTIIATSALLCAAIATQAAPVKKAPARKASAKQAAPASSLPAPSLNGAKVFVKYSLIYYPSYNTTFEQLVLFPDGTAFDEVPDKPISSFSVAGLRKIVKPIYIGRWKVAGNTLTLNFPNKSRTLRKHPHGWADTADKPPEDSAYGVYYPVVSPPRAQMLGAWKFSSLMVMGTSGGGTPMVAAGTSGDWIFGADGTFRDGSTSFVSGTTTNMGNVFKGEGDVTQTGHRNQSSSGKWRIDGPLLTLEKNGQRTVHLAFLMPYWTKNAANTDLMIDGDRWKRPEKK